MRKSPFKEEQIVYVLRQAEAGVPVPELCRTYGLSEQTYYRWKRKYGKLEAATVLSVEVHAAIGVGHLIRRP